MNNITIRNIPRGSGKTSIIKTILLENAIRGNNVLCIPAFKFSRDMYLELSRNFNMTKNIEVLLPTSVLKLSANNLKEFTIILIDDVFDINTEVQIELLKLLKESGVRTEGVGTLLEPNARCELFEDYVIC